MILCVFVLFSSLLLKARRNIPNMQIYEYYLIIVLSEAIAFTFLCRRTEETLNI